MSRRQKAQAAFVSAVALLFLSGLAVYFTITRLLESEKWVVHTHEVRAAIGDIDSAVLRAGRARSGYTISESDDFWGQFEAATLDIPRALQHLRELTRDNRRQQELCSLLEGATARRVALLQESIRLKKDTPDSEQKQADLVRQSLPISSQMTSIMQQMREEEQQLLSDSGAIRASTAYSDGCRVVRRVHPGDHAVLHGI